MTGNNIGQSERDLLSRLDERTAGIDRNLQSLKEENSAQSTLVRDEIKALNNLINVRISELEKDIDKRFKDFRSEVSEEFVTKESFSPVKTLIYGMVGVILLGFVGTLVSISFSPK